MYAVILQEARGKTPERKILFNCYIERFVGDIPENNEFEDSTVARRGVL
jgi:hypothetical protein